MGINYKIIYRIVGLLFMVFSSILLLPMMISTWTHDGFTQYYVICLVSQFIVGFLFWFPFRKQIGSMRRKEGFLIVVIFWLSISLLGASVFVFTIQLSYVDAIFESVSGLTTTGATVITGLDDLPYSILFYRQELQWFGGMGLIMLAVAIMPMLGIGGMKMYLAETPGPLKEEKITPRLVTSAKVLWGIYVGITILCAIAYWIAGMTVFDAVSHSMSTVSTGGFSTHDESMGYFNSNTIDLIAIFFMLLGGINFSVHFLVLRDKNLNYYWKNTEVRMFLLFVLIAIITVALLLHLTLHVGSFIEELRDVSFEVVSVVTSTGFGLADFSVWPLFLPFLMILISFVGGCGGSTAGGMKVMRIVMMMKLVGYEIKKLIHPHGIFTIKFDGYRVVKNIRQNILGFFCVYSTTFVILLLLMMFVSGLDQVTSFSAIATSMNNLGPGLGEVTQNFVSVNSGGKIISALAMLLGRLEIFSILVLFSPEFWR